MRTLPEALSEIEVPDALAVSQLGGWGGCVAKLALGSQRQQPSRALLPGGPAAAKGTLAHRVLEQWIKGKGSHPSEVFAAVYEQFREELQSDPARVAFAELRDVFGPAEWNWFRAWVLRRCEAANRNVHNPMPKGTSLRIGPETLTGVEVLLVSSAMRLKGRADSIRRIDGSFYEIRDFKSGTVRDDDGNVKDSIAVQLRAYGLMFLEAKPGAEVVLVVDAGEELRVSFDDAARESARDEIQTAMKSVPAAGKHPAAMIAKTGPDCFGCSARHLCATYVTQAPSWWLSYPDRGDRISYDSWGTITAVREGIDGVDVTLIDAAGRRVLVDRLDHRHGLTVSHVGRALWLLDLESSGPAMDFKGRRHHPRVFHELPRDRRERRAWGLQLFLGP